MEITNDIAKEVLLFSETLGVPINWESSFGLRFEAETLLEEAESSLHDTVAKKIHDKYGYLIKKSKDTNAEEFLYQREELPIPKYLEIDKVPEMPTDLTICSEQEIRKLHSEFHAYQIRTNWLIAQQEAEVAAQKNTRTQLYNSILMRTDLLMPADGNRARKEKTKMILDAEISQDKRLRELTDKLNNLETDLNFLKTLRDIYESNCNRLSRESSMRFSEVKHSGSI